MDIEKIFLKFVKVLAVIVLFLILLNNIVINDSNSSIPNSVIIVIAFITIFFGKLLEKKKNNEEKDISMKKYILITIILFLSMIAVQFIIVNNYYFRTGWDPRNLYFIANEYVKLGDLNIVGKDFNYTYLSTFYNNLTICRFYCFVASHIKGIDVYRSLVTINCIIIDLTLILMLRVLSNFKVKKKNKIIGLLFFILLIGVSPWILVPYTDTFSMFMITIILYNYTKNNKKFYNYISIGFWLVLGYFIKPTAVIIGIAIAIIEIIKLFNKIFKKKDMLEIFKKYLIAILMIVIGVFLGFVVEKMLEKQYPFDINRIYSLTIYHYFMMGLNEETKGAFDVDDFWNTYNIQDKEERKEYNIKVWKERLKELDVKFLLDKLDFIYDDGTFAWEEEGFFYCTKFEYKDERLFKKLFNYFNSEGESYSIFASICQFIWISLLEVCFIGLFMNKLSTKELVLVLTFIGQTMFLMIFEARARYLIIYLPVFICLATLCLNNLKLPKKVEKPSNSSV